MYTNLAPEKEYWQLRKEEWERTRELFSDDLALSWSLQDFVQRQIDRCDEFIKATTHMS